MAKIAKWKREYVEEIKRLDLIGAVHEACYTSFCFGEDGADDTDLFRCENAKEEAAARAAVLVAYLKAIPDLPREVVEALDGKPVAIAGSDRRMR
jgi:hypothetical protein